MEIKNCVCGAEPVVTKSRGRWVIACPNQDTNICSYPDKYTAVKNWNEEVERRGSVRKRD